MKRLFADRASAGREVAAAFTQDVGRKDVVVLGLPRGGVPVAYEVARSLGAPLDVLLVRKLGLPGHEELAIGAIASCGVRVLNDGVLSRLGVEPAVVEAVAERELAEMQRQERFYRDGRGPLPVDGFDTVAVDDGLATGATMRAAVMALRRRGARSIAVALPIAARRSCAELAELVDYVVCAHTPERCVAVGAWYRDFGQVSDEDVRDLLERARDAARTGR
ncbi:MAG TPA: phosphoribosyltransferase [Solirubrobacteraceae bacterium]|nr:phosphoribosyltransferase [Solirubrobacteraceae bacterium]